MAGIRAEEVTKSYPMKDGSRITVLDDIDVTVEDGEFFSMVGPSGCGKSTLLSILAGFVDPDRGDIELEGSGSDSRIGFVFQDPTLLDWKTVGENVKFALESMGVPESEHDERIDDVLDRVGLSEFRDEYPQQLSGGMRQRVGLARALSIDPDVLMMDEPFSSLDEITARELRQDLLDIWRKEGKTVLFVTHNIQEAAYLSDRIAILSQKPTQIQTLVEVDIDRPRSLEDSEIIDYEAVVLEELGIKE
jgi:ABC-type nitrate/sulfonate/bicarbonate transport system ATPase subunit